jgi:hypothetical protein
LRAVAVFKRGFQAFLRVETYDIDLPEATLAGLCDAFKAGD